MTKIEIFKKEGIIQGFVVSGHSGYADEGYDIVCSAISSLSQMVCVGLDNVLNLNPIIQIQNKTAYLSCFLKGGLTQKQVKDAQVLLNTFEETVNLLLCGDKKFKKYINLEVKNEVY